MSNVLERIVARTRADVAARSRAVPAAELAAAAARMPPVRSFRAALERGPAPAIIAEVKKASPSAGVLRAVFDPVAIARTYAAAGASAISVLTDEPFFQGHLDYLRAIRRVVELPLLRKDFIVERYQVLEARAAGADAVLLIAEVLGEAELPALVRDIQDLGMEPLVELYDRAHLPRVLASGAGVIGVNNRDLRSFVTRLEHTLELMADVPADRCLVSESGIRSRADLERLAAAGVKAVLIGETFMRADDIAAKLRELRGV
jgi:indole-3-glycerol phosphate synthase